MKEPSISMITKLLKEPSIYDGKHESRHYDESILEYVKI
jgi:hypothetical protein